MVDEVSPGDESDCYFCELRPHGVRSTAFSELTSLTVIAHGMHVCMYMCFNSVVCKGIVLLGASLRKLRTCSCSNAQQQLNMSAVNAKRGCIRDVHAYRKSVAPLASYSVGLDDITKRCSICNTFADNAQSTSTLIIMYLHVK